MKPFIIAHVIWEDSEATGSWVGLESISASLNITHSCGFLIHQSDKFILMALSYDPDTNSLNCFKKIPTSAVKSINLMGRIEIEVSSPGNLPTD